jgi:hypothetical protein
MPETQTLLFNAGTGLTIVCKLFGLNSDTVVATATAVERSFDLNRYIVTFTDIPAGAYRLNGFVSGTGGFANEIYDLTLSTATFFPRSEATIDNIAIADAVLTRSVSNVEATAPEHSLATIVLAMLEFNIVGNVLTIKRTDGTTVHYTKTLSTNPNAQRITGVD